MNPRTKIIPIPEEDQKTVIEEYNETKRKHLDKIPLVMRNHQTGWPLLQTSFFSPTSDNEYEPVLGGGKCHEFPITHFTLACLLANVGGKKSLKGNTSESEIEIKIGDLDIKQLNLGNIYKHFLGSFIFEEGLYRITLKSESGPWGKVTEIIFADPDLPSAQMHRILQKAFNLCFKNEERLKIFQLVIKKQVTQKI